MRQVRLQLQSISRRIPVRGAARDVGALTIATVLGQIVLLFASPLITRAYSPTEFGVFSALLGAATLLATLSAISYPMAIPLATSRQDSSELFWMMVMTSLALAPLGALAVYVFIPDSSPIVSSWSEVLILTLTAFLLAIWGGLRAVAARQNEFNSIAVSGVSDNTLQAGTQLGLGFGNLGALGLSSGYLAGKLAAVAILVWRVGRHLVRPHRPWKVAKKWLRHSLLVTPTTLLNQASVTAVSSFFALLFGVFAAGQFSLAARILAVPSALFGQAVGTVFFPKIARLTREGRSTLMAVETVATGLIQVALPIFGLIALLGPNLFAIVFGPDWRSAGVAASILAPWLALNLVSSPIASVATVHQRLKQLLALGAAEATLRLGALALGGWVDNWYLGIALYSGVGCLISLYTSAWVLRLSGGSLFAWLGSWPKLSWVLVGSIAVVAMVRPLVPAMPFVLLSCMLCTAAGVVGICTLLKMLPRIG